jgi:HEAT repeat protein
MTRRRVILLTLVLLAAAAGVAVALDPAARVQGWVNGEPFYHGRSATAWRRDLRRPDGERSAGALNELIAGKGEAVPVCAWVLRTAPEAEARWRAADALSQMGRDAASAAAELVAALADNDQLVRGVAIRAVGELAPDAPGGVPALVALFPNIEAIRAVARFGPAGAAAVPRLIELTKSDDPTVRWQAIRTLGKIGPPALPALPELIRLSAADPDALVREHAVETIGDIGPAADEGIPALVKALRDPVARVRRDAVRSLGQMGAAAKPVLDDVRAATRDPDPDVSAAAGRAARLIDPAAGEKK